jgi:5-methylcytosine-specific restriction endonuclease McrA
MDHNHNILTPLRYSPPQSALNFKLNDRHYNIPEHELLLDLQKVTATCGGQAPSLRKYDEMGKFCSGTICRRFGTWNKALQKAGLAVARVQKITDKELFKNMESVWIRLGRQPTFREMQKPLSEYSTRPYLYRFGSFVKALQAFIGFINAGNNNSAQTKQTDELSTEPLSAEEALYKHKTKRIPSERLKVKVLMRDGNKCRLCGETLTGDNIHFDHIVPWSRGGETVLENLQVLCKKHNWAKGDLNCTIR